MAKQNFKNGTEVYLINPENGYRYRVQILGKEALEKKEHDVYIVRFIERPIHYNEYPWECKVISEKHLIKLDDYNESPQAIRRRSWYEDAGSDMYGLENINTIE